MTDFRSYAALRFNPTSRINVFAGPNGAGKTNLLEAVSLLAPGRGLRGARVAELARTGPDASGQWAVAAQLQANGVPATSIRIAAEAQGSGAAARLVN